MTPSMHRPRFVALAAVAALLLSSPGTAAAHAELLEATPADGAVVEGTPEEISARFSEPLTEGSTFSLRDAVGERLAVGRVDPDDPTRLVIDPVPELVPGAYEVRWRAASADGHAENDTWSFTVTPPPTPEPTPLSTASAEPTGPATPEPTATANPTASPGPSDPAGTSDGDAILPIIAALALVLVVAAVLLSRRGRPSDRV